MLLDNKFRDRFWIKVDKKDGDACWEWRASCGFGDYGKFRVGGTYIPAHRIAYLLTYGPFDYKLKVCHACDNRKCCNPGHLFLGTVSDNNLDKCRKGRHKFETPWGRSNFHKEHRWRNHAKKEGNTISLSL